MSKLSCNIHYIAVRFYCSNEDILLEHDKALDALSLDGMGDAHDGGLRNDRVANQGALHLHCADPVLSDVQQVVAASRDKEEACKTQRQVPVGSNITTQRHKRLAHRPCRDARCPR